MARWSPGRIGWTAAAGALALGGCDKLPEAERGAPPRANDAIELEAQNSVIAVPVEIGLDQIHAALERAVPRQLWTIDERGQTCIASDKVKVLVVRIKTPKIKCDLVGEVTRGPLGLTGQGRDLVITMPIRATVRAKRIAGIIEQETATASAQVRGVVRLGMGSDWSPRGRIEIDYNWTREPGIDFLGQRIKLTGPADQKLKGVIARLERTLPSELAKLGLDACREVATSATLLYFTLDEFKRNCYLYGRAKGDDALKTFADVLRIGFRESDVVGRLEGDRFAALLTGSSVVEIDAIKARLDEILDERNATAHRSYDIRFRVVQVEYDPEVHDSIEDLLAEAERVMSR